MKPVPSNPNNFDNPSRDMAITAFAGPYSNFIQALLWVIIYKIVISIILVFNIKVLYPAENSLIFFLSSEYMLNPVYSFAYYFHLIFENFIFINLILMVFNLLPVPPLDGGWILRHFIPARYKPTFDRIYRFGIFILYALFYIGVLRFIMIPAFVLFGMISFGFTIPPLVEILATTVSTSTVSCSP